MRANAMFPLVGLLATAVTSTAFAGVIDLFDLNSQVRIDTGTKQGLHDWLVDGTDHMVQDWYWLRVGPTGGETSLDGLTDLGTTVADTNSFTDDRNDALSARFGAASGLEIELLYTLRGGVAGSNISNISRQVIFENTGNDLLEISFFHYADLDVSGTDVNDLLSIVNGDRARQLDEATGLLADSVANGAPAHVEAAFVGETIGRLQDTDPTTLNGVTGPLDGDVTWAFQWNITLAPGASFILGTDTLLSPVPGPGALTLLMVAGLASGRRRRC